MILDLVDAVLDHGKAVPSPGQNSVQDVDTVLVEYVQNAPVSQRVVSPNGIDARLRHDKSIRRGEACKV